MLSFVFRIFILFIVLALLPVHAIVLPQKNIQNEIKWQLLELATANVDIRFANQFDKVVKASQNADQALYAKELKNSYFLILNFRKYFDSLPWHQKQYLSFKLPTFSISSQLSEEYDTKALNGMLLSDLINLRPNIPFYTDYRVNIKKYLTTKDLNLPSYKYRLLNIKSRGSAVVNVKKALKILGYLDAYAPIDGDYDLELREAVIAFQKDNLLKPDGVIGFRTYKAIYRSNNERAVALARSVLRLNDKRLKDTNPYVFVNLPESMLHVYQDGQSVIDSRVIFGKYKAQTPLLYSLINNVVINPTWTVPKSIKKEYLYHLREDPLYLQKRGVDIVNNELDVIDPLSIAHNEFTEQDFKYNMRQMPGKNNPLGLYKFNFPNKADVYLHSTNQPYLFNKDNRALSHGCVRVEKAEELALYLLKDTRYNADVIKALINKGDTKWATLAFKTPVFIAYLTAYIGQDEKVYFHDDVYLIDHDAKVLPYNFLRHFK